MLPSILDSIDRLIQYHAKDEHKDFLENDKPDNHIYTDIYIWLAASWLNYTSPEDYPLTLEPPRRLTNSNKR